MRRRKRIGTRWNGARRKKSERRKRRSVRKRGR
jgi:hypothetical protein